MYVACVVSFTWRDKRGMDVRSGEGEGEGGGKRIASLSINQVNKFSLYLLIGAGWS